MAGVPLDPAAGTAFAAMINGAQRAGYSLSAAYGYRSVDLQRTLFVNRLGGLSAAQLASGANDATIDAALRWVAPPGYSKHQTGYTIDLRAGGSAGDFGSSPVAQWLSAGNYAVAKSYGFIPSYPPGSGLQGPEPEPWEYVYVGTQAIECSPWLARQNDRLTFDVCAIGTPISTKYFALGGPNGFLGRVTAQEGTVGDGRGARFTGGEIYSLFWTGTHEVHGSILGELHATGGVAGSLGFPASDELATPEGGRSNTFQRGMIFFRPYLQQSFAVAGLFADELVRSGGIGGPLGYPRARTAGGPEGRSYIQDFDGGRIFVLAADRTYSVGGGVLDRYLALGGSTGVLGLPTGPLAPDATSADQIQPFEHGALRLRPDGTVVESAAP